MTLLRNFVTLYSKINFIPSLRFVKRICPNYASKDFFFVQIGANDGRLRDPLFNYAKKYHWSGILVEPVKHYFDNLVRNYSTCKNTIFKNVAISEKREKRKMYRIKEDAINVPTWCHGLASFYKENLLSRKWVIKDIEKYIVEEEVQCLPLIDIIRCNGVKKIDLLIIDAEGYDYNIIMQLDSLLIRPRIIFFEHVHLDEKRMKACNNLLRKKKYNIKKGFQNTIAYTSKSSPSLLAL